MKRKNKKVCMYIIAHKKFESPVLDFCYQPLWVGAVKNKCPDGWQGDDTGDNISHKNGEYCELTGLYWIWKNSDADIVGLCHYRRYFAKFPNKILNVFTGKVSGLYTEKYIRRALKTCDIIMHNRTFITGSVRKQYSANHSEADIENCRDIISRKYPGYLTAFDECMASKSIHFLNMFIMPRKLMNEYCEWLFDILGELESRYKDSGHDCSRLFGFVSEILFDVWVKGRGLKVRPGFAINTERNDCKLIIK